ncbi:MAG TPA: SEC-C metal-binding domain-containing protein [Burkholderiales bacterium]|nr:SEC-C metal-binding domain-containing protein [Burkholderiales bacterium]
MDNLVVPYLYGLSYFDKFTAWPWGEYSHGGLGLLEFYCDAPEQSAARYAEIIGTLQSYKDIWPWIRKQLRKPNAKTQCICGSGAPFGKCHAAAWRGLCRMLAGIRRLGVTPDSLRKSSAIQR